MSGRQSRGDERKATRVSFDQALAEVTHEALALLPVERELGVEECGYWPWLWDPAGWRKWWRREDGPWLARGKRSGWAAHD